MSLHSRAPRPSETKRPAAPSRPSPLARAGMEAGGQALDRHTQASMSARFGHDFSAVRIHTDARAVKAAGAMGANAFAHGSDIVFGPGQYTPGSPSTERLLAHELTHVAQQDRFGPGDPSRMSDRADSSEREADALSEQVVMGRSVQAQAAPQAAVARDERDDAPFSMMSNPNAYHPDLGPSVWDHVKNSSPYQIATHDTVGGAASLAVNKLDAVEGTAKQAALARDINMKQFRLNHPELTPLGSDASAAARAAQQEGWGMNSVAEATGRESQGPMLPIGRSAEEGEQAIQNAERWDLPLKGLPFLKFASRVASPFSAYGDGKSMIEDWQNGNHADAVADGAGMTSGVIGSIDAAAALGTWTGLASTGGALASTAEFLNPVGAVLAAGAGGYAAGKYALGKANTYAKDNNIFGKGDDGESRDSTEAAGDAGVAVDKGVHSLTKHIPVVGDTLGDYVGGQLGAETAVVSSVGTAAYSGIHALGSYLFGGSDNAPLAEPGAGSEAGP